MAGTVLVTAIRSSKETKVFSDLLAVTTGAGAPPKPMSAVVDSVSKTSKALLEIDDMIRIFNNSSSQKTLSSLIKKFSLVLETITIDKRVNQSRLLPFLTHR